MHALKVLAAAAAVATIAGAAQAETPEEKGLAIAKEIDRRDLGWGDSEVRLKMELRNRQGQSSKRDLRLRSLEITDPTLGDLSLSVFDRPRDVKGTAFLSHTKIKEADDQWLFLPALKRVKRISSANKSGPFVGSEFAYEDLLSQEVAKYTYKWLRDEPCGKLTCFVIERYPVYENSGYTKQVTWIDQEEYRPIRIDFYDRKEAKLKTLTLTDHKKYLDKYWRAHSQEMVNHQTGKSTTLTFEGFKFRIGLTKTAFTPGRLKRVR